MINRFWSSFCKRCREETRGGNSKALLCGESDLAKSVFFCSLDLHLRVCSFSCFLSSLCGFVLLWFLLGSPWVRADPTARLSAFPAWIPRKQSRYLRSLICIPPETHREVQSAGTLLQNPVGVFNSKAASSTHHLQCFILLCSFALSVN